MGKWENVANGIAIVIILTFLEKITNSFWFKYIFLIPILFIVLYIVSKINFLQKPVSKKVGWLTFTVTSILIIFLPDFILK